VASNLRQLDARALAPSERKRRPRQKQIVKYQLGGIAEIISDFFNSIGQNPRLPQRSIDSRLTLVNRHYASEAVQPFVAPSMSSLDSDFVLRVIQVFRSTIAKAWRCRALNSFSASTVSNSVNTLAV